jgi:ribosomal protein S17E
LVGWFVAATNYSRSFSVFGRRFGSDCVLRTASVSISRSSAFVFGGARGVFLPSGNGQYVGRGRRIKSLCVAQFYCALHKTGYSAVRWGCPKINRRISMIDMTVVQDKMKAIATAHTDYAKTSFEANKVYLEKLATTKAPDQAMQITTEHMKSGYETFVTEATKIGDMYKDFFKSAFEPITAAATKLTVVN